MPRPIDKNLLADMFARAAELKTTQSPDGRAAGRVLLSSIFERVRQLKVRPAPGPAADAPAAASVDPVARGWNEEADQRARPVPPGVDPDDLQRTRHLAVEEFRSSLAELFSDSDSDELLIATERAPESEVAEAPVVAAPSGEPARGSMLFTAAAEELFGIAMEDLEELVFAAWERRMRGEPLPPPAPRAAPSPHPQAYAAGPTASPALVSLEDGELLLDKPKKKDLSSSDVDHILTDFAFDGGNPVPAAEVVRRAKDQAPAPKPAPQPAPRPAPQPAPQPARNPESVPTLPWGAPPREEQQAAASATIFDPFARPIPLPTQQQQQQQQQHAPADAFAPPPRGGPLDAFAPPPPGLDAFGRPRQAGHTPPPSWRTHSGPQPIATPHVPGPTWKGSGQQPALQGGWQPQPPQAPQPQPPVAMPHVPAGWPFVDAPTTPAPTPPRTPSVQPPSARYPRPTPPAPAPPPPQATKPRSPPSGEGFDPFAPSWWDEKPRDGDVKL